MTSSLITVSPETSVSEARQTMERRVIRHLLVMEGDQLVGIVTDRDIRLNLPSPATSLSIWEINYILAKLTVGEVMTKRLITIGPEQPIEEGAHLMLEHRISAVPVLDQGRLVGIVTETDVLRAFVQSQAATNRCLA